MIKSKLTGRARTTIPLAVRIALQLAQGDVVVYAIDGDRVVLAKARRVPADDPFATFGEWSSESDRRGYADL